MNFFMAILLAVSSLGSKSAPEGVDEAGSLLRAVGDTARFGGLDVADGDGENEAHNSGSMMLLFMAHLPHSL